MKTTRSSVVCFIQITLFLLISFQPLIVLNVVNVKAASTIYVPGDYSSIQDAIDNASGGDTIVVNSSTYKETISIHKGITLQGEDRETTIIDGMNSGDTIDVSANGVTISGFTICNASDDGINIGWVNGTVLNDCKIEACGDEGIYMYRTYSTSIENCTFTDIGDRSIRFTTSQMFNISGCEIFNTSRGIYGVTCSNGVIEYCDIYNNDGNGIELLQVFNTRIAHSHIHNNSNYGIYVSRGDYNIIDNCSIYLNSEGLYILNSDWSEIVECIVYDNINDGISCQTSDRSLVRSCESYNNGDDGCYLATSDYFRVVDCNFTSNSDVGISTSGSDLGIIQNTVCSINENGIRLYESDIASIYNCTVYSNTLDGLLSTNSKMTYVSGSQFFNSSKGCNFIQSSFSVTNCNLTNNQYGLLADWSNGTVKYCSIQDNSIYGVQSNQFTIDATENWWGNASGPSHASLNPTGIGDSVSNYVDFDPWLSEPTQPEVLLSDLRCRILRNQVNQTVYVPTGNIYDDSTFYAFYSVKEAPQLVSAPTQGSSTEWLNPDGSPKFQGDIVTFGGRAANRMVAYYEDAGIAKLGFQANGTHRIFKRLNDDFHVYAAPTAGYNKTEKDYFQFQVYKDGDRTVLSLWGFGAEGTYAGGICFIDLLLPELGTFTDSYYVFSWTDMNGDAKPQPNEIQQEAQGS